MKLQIGEMEPQMDISYQQMKLPAVTSNEVVEQSGPMETPNNPEYCQSY